MYDFERNEKVIYCEEEVDESKPETEEQELILEQSEPPAVWERLSGGSPGMLSQTEVCARITTAMESLHRTVRALFTPRAGHDGAQAQLKT